MKLLKKSLILFAVLSSLSASAFATCTSCGAGPGGSWQSKNTCPKTCCKSGSPYNVKQKFSSNTEVTCVVNGSSCTKGSTCSTNCGCK